MSEGDYDRRKITEALRNKLALVPEQPGCYLMKNRDGTIIYVGKAKVLRNRLRSYFTGSHGAKTQRLVSEIADFEYIVTGSNVEALILECNLIKKHTPRYNVLLKDDKSFPYIKITNETHPRLEVTRRVVKDKAKYFGPYPNAFSAQQTKKLLDRLYPLRKCRTLPDKVCLYYHLGQCVAPCEYPVERETYEQMVGEITRFLNGGHNEIKDELMRKMHEAAEQLNFERAKELRDQIAHIDAVMEKQKITMSDQVDRDVFGFATDKGWMCVQILYMRQGKLIERHASMFPFYGEEYDDFLTFVSQYYSDNPALPKEIFLPMQGDAPKGAAVVSEGAGDSLPAAAVPEGQSESLSVAAAQEGSGESVSASAVPEGQSGSLSVAAAQEGPGKSVSASAAPEGQSGSLSVAAAQEGSGESVSASAVPEGQSGSLPPAAVTEGLNGSWPSVAAPDGGIDSLSAICPDEISQQDRRLEDGEAAAALSEAAAEAAKTDIKEALESWLKVKVHMPRRGLKKNMVDMACDNARVALEEKFRLIERDEERTVKAVENLGEWLGIGMVRRIEAFDNSNIQGTNPVSAMVVFTDGKPDRKEYRKYKVRTVQGPDDYETMREVVRRRYERVLKEGLPLPDLIVIDGGKGQIAAAIDVLENELGLGVPVCGLAKDAKHKTSELLIGDPPHVVPIPRDSQEFYLLQRIQDEVHRFAVTFHRQSRSKSMIESQLDGIPGIGEKRRKQLLKHFGSVKKMREATLEDFKAAGIGEKLAAAILQALNEDASPASGAESTAQETAAD